MTPPPRFEIAEAEIAAVVVAFHAEVRLHPVLGPVFGAHVTDWPAHEAKIARFWRNTILYERSCDGNPVAVHRAAGDVKPAMFAVWLALFDAILRREVTRAAAGWSALAHRIGRGLRMGLETSGDVPILG